MQKHDRVAKSLLRFIWFDRAIYYIQSHFIVCLLGKKTCLVLFKLISFY
jgi:hypothetical protein